MGKDIDIATMQRLIEKVQLNILTSNDVVSRIDHPYFHDHPSVPKALSNFKMRLQEYRMTSSAKMVAMERVVLGPNMLPIMSDFSVGSFSHMFVGALVVSAFGIGDCAECSARLAIEMLANGYGDLTFLGIQFPNAQYGMEKTHQFIVANLPKSPDRGVFNTSIFDFFKTLPQNAIIGDPFLKLAFKPNDIPETFIRYINTYGANTQVIQCWHFCNLGPRFLGHYLSTTTRLAKELQTQQSLPDDRSYDLDDKIKVEDPTLILLLKERTPLPFFGLRDDAYKVDAVTEIKTKQDRITALSLQDTAQRYGRFFQSKDEQRMFVLEGINLRSEHPNIWDHVYGRLS